MKHLLFISTFVLFFGCKSEPSAAQKDTPITSISEETNNAPVAVFNPDGKNIETRFSPPAGYERIPLPVATFGYYLRTFPLHAFDRKVHLFNGELKGNQAVHAAVLDIDVGKRDLQQCADAVMRLRAEYFFDAERFEEIHFKFVSGFDAEYSKWRAGKKIKVKGSKVKWVSADEKQDTRAAFRKYLDVVFSYASTLSLTKEMRPKELDDIEIGDVFIQGGSPGHAIIVVDSAVNELTGDRVFMLAQSYMPAQEIHILKNVFDPITPWYSVNSIENEVRTPEWTFDRNDLKSF